MRSLGSRVGFAIACSALVTPWTRSGRGLVSNVSVTVVTEALLDPTLATDNVSPTSRGTGSG